MLAWNDSLEFCAGNCRIATARSRRGFQRAIAPARTFENRCRAGCLGRFLGRSRSGRGFRGGDSFETQAVWVKPLLEKPLLEKPLLETLLLEKIRLEGPRLEPSPSGKPWFRKPPFGKPWFGRAAFDFGDSIAPRNAISRLARSRSPARCPVLDAVSLRDRPPVHCSAFSQDASPNFAAPNVAAPNVTASNRASTHPVLLEIRF